MPRYLWYNRITTPIQNKTIKEDNIMEIARKVGQVATVDEGPAEMVYPPKPSPTNMMKLRAGTGWKGQCKKCGRTSKRYRTWEQVVEWAEYKHPEARYRDEEQAKTQKAWVRAYEEAHGKIKV